MSVPMDIGTMGPLFERSRRRQRRGTTGTRWDEQNVWPVGLHGRAPGGTFANLERSGPLHRTAGQGDLMLLVAVV